MKRFWRNVLVGFLFWTAYNFLNAGILTIQENLPYLASWISMAIVNYPMAVMSIGLWFLCKKVPFRKHRIPLFLTFHILVGTLFSAVWLAVSYGLRALFYPSGVHRYLIDAGVYLWQFLDGLTKYGFLVGIFYTILFYRQLKEKELRETELSLLAKKMELQNLKSQLNPHFLFNALNSVSALMAKDPEKARTMNAKLAQLLRFSLEGYDERFVTLKQELEFVRNYLEIEKVRFGERLKVREEVAQEALACHVPSMLLQPIVENAVRHGISKQAEGGHLRIQATCQNGVLNLEVANTGKPIPPTALSGFLEQGIGLKNTDARLKRLYGPAFGLQLESQPAGGLCVKITIPQTSEQAEA